MDIYSTSFTIPRSTGGATFHDGGEVISSPATAVSPTVPSSTGNSAVSSSSFSEVNSVVDRSDGLQARRQDGSTFARFGSMRSRLPPSVKAFMPAAFGGSKRTSERIIEAVGTGSEKESENEAESEESSAFPFGTEKGKKSGLANEKATNESGYGKKLLAPGGEDAVAVDGSGSTEDEGNTVVPQASTTDAKSDESLNASKHSSSKALTTNRDSRSTVGTKSSVDLSSNASVDSTAPSTVPAMGNAKPPRTPSEPRSISHSASGSMIAFGVHSQPFGATDMAEAMQRLSIETMNAHQCLINFTSVQDETMRTLHANGSSTSLSSDPFHRHTFPSMPPSSVSSFTAPHSGFPYPTSTFDSSAASAFGSGAGFGPSRSPMHATLSSSSTSLRNQQLPHTQSGRSLSHFNFHLTGGYQQVMAARGQVLREHPFRARSTIKVARSDLLDLTAGSGSLHGPIPADNLKPEVRRRLDDIALTSSCAIFIAANELQSADLGYGLETERHAEIVIAGPFEGVEQAKVRVMVMLDELSGLHMEACEIDFKLHNIIGGRKRCVIQSIQEETATNIYLPTPFPSVLSAHRSPAMVARQNTIFITGEFFGVQRARDMLYQVSMHKSKGIISRSTAVLPRKIDWVLTERLDELRSIMLDNATFVSLPMLGSQASLITVYGDSRVSIERTIRSVMQLACQFFVASVWLLPIAFDGVMAPPSLTSAQVTPILKHVSTNSGAEVAFKGNCFEMHGLETEVRAAVSLFLDLDLLKSFNLEIRFQIELANEHREFISGKKNGKINKIMKQGVRIKFETFNDYNFLIDVSSNDRTGTMQGLSLLLEELPAEMSFHIPENYHKRIIGVGGKNIQKTMKKFGVYVKFYSKQDLDVETYPFLDAEDNVIARTPAKNTINLENLKAAVTELVNPKDKDFVSENVPIARRYHRTLLGEKGIFIHDIENKLGCTIRFPPPESTNDLVSIFGPESQIHIAAQMLLDHVPFEAEFRTPESPDLTRVLASHEFVALVERVKRDLNINIVPIANGSTSSPSPVLPSHGASIGGGSSSPPTTDVVFKLRLNRSSADFLPAAKDALEDFLVSRNVQVYRSLEQRARTDSFASSFHHFANKLISVPQGAESTDSFQTDPTARFNRQQVQQQQGQDSNRLRAAASTPDIKALFDSPSMASGPFIPPSVPLSSVSNATLLTNAPMAAAKSALYSSPYQDALRMPTGLGGSDVWGAPTNLTNSGPAVRPSPGAVGGNGGGMSTSATSMSGIAFPQHATRASDEVGLQNAGSASEIADGGPMDDRLGTLRKSRAYSHRTQSLDIGALAAQQVMQQAITAGGRAHQQQHEANPSNSHHHSHSGSGKHSMGSTVDIAVPSSGAISSANGGGGASPYVTSTVVAGQRPYGAIGSRPAAGGTTSLHAMGGSNSFSGTQGSPFGGAMLGQHAPHHSLPPGYGVPSSQYGRFPQQSQPQQQTQQQQHPFTPPQSQPQHSQPHHVQQPHHHIHTSSISRLAPSALQRAPEPETTDEVLRSLAQLHFHSAS